MIQFNSDKISIRGPSVDGSYKAIFDVGEHEQLNMAKLLALPQQTNITVTVTIEGEKKVQTITGEEFDEIVQKIADLGLEENPTIEGEEDK